MRVNMKYIILLSISLLFVACSSNNAGHDATTEEADTRGSNDFVAIEMDEQLEENVIDDAGLEKIDSPTTDRMVIHQAQLFINVHDIDKTQANIEAKVNKYDGYIVQANMYREKDIPTSGYMMVRIPASHFQTFLSDTEEAASEVLERNVTGDDVTEQFVDLEARLKSKRAVEKRLLEFMEEAEKTEDLLKISSDLANVQEEIEVIVGQMNLLENQTDYSTVEITMYDNRVIIPDLEKEDLNTWEKTKKQLATSTNFLLAAGSSIIVFVVGNLPVLIILSMIGLIVYATVRKKLSNRNKNK